MDADDLDFECLLDAALGIQPSAPDAPDNAALGRDKHSSSTMYVASPVVSYDQPSPAGSPVHVSCYISPCSPCISSSSMQMHASLQDGVRAESECMYSPVRESGSPPPDQQSPVRLSERQNVPEAAPGTGVPPAAAEAATVDPHYRQQNYCLTSLPREVQMRVLCFLSADALTTLAQSCKQLASLCSEPVLWRRLFVARWGKKVRAQGQQTWKEKYMERDVSELRAAAGNGAGGLADAMQDMFVQAHIARRQQALGRAAIDDLMLVEDDEVAARVSAWRKSRGFDRGPGAENQPQRPTDIAEHVQGTNVANRQRDMTGLGCGASGFPIRRGVVRRRPASNSSSSAAAAAAACAGAGGQPAGSPVAAAAAAGASNRACNGESSGQHETAISSQVQQAAGASSSSRAAGSSSGVGSKRPRQRRRWTQIGNVFCDELTGWVHVCDETCSEKVIEPSSGLLVCPISGQVSDRMMTCVEEAEEEGPGDDEDGKGQQEEDYGGEKGRLARAFETGYYCSDERELMRKCGVRLSRR